MDIKVISESESETIELGKRIGARLSPGLVLALNGTLGTGKTRLTQGLGQAIGIAKGEIVSPTYTLCTPHEGELLLVHLDAYRIAEVEEVDELGLDELVEEGAVLVVEWADRVAEYIPPIDLTIQLESTSENTRSVSMSANSEKGQILLDQI
ncbi:MAG: tRNA (adenosine(37)-N6)-threonylcarbamoyltransferase complex ATPase subunit type 1 TsaE [Planctomycetota bacterium]